MSYLRAVFASLAACHASPALAQIDLRTAEQKAAPQTWNVTVGARIGAAPAFPGAADMRFSAAPVFSIGRGLGSRWLSAADDGIGIGLVEGDYWRAGVSGKFLWRRRASDHAELRGLKDVGFGGELGAFAEVYPLSWLRARAEVRHGLFAHHAVTADLKLDAFARLDERWIVSAGPRLTIAGQDYTQTYFGVNPGQSLLSGLPQFKAGGGVHAVGAAGQVSYQWTARLQTSAYVQYNRLVGSAVRSPIVTGRGSRDQLSVGLATRWTIDTGL
jgi:MipA family protein